MALGAALTGASEAEAATFTVTNLNDAGAGSLRQAVLDANATPGVDAVAFQSGVSGTIALTSGEIAIGEAVSIYGPGAGVVTVSGSDTSRIFNIDLPVGEVEISALTLADGRADVGGAILTNDALELTDVVMTGNFAELAGGAISMETGSLTIQSSLFSGNEALVGGAIQLGYYYSGAGVTTEIAGSTFTNNRASGGGAIYVNYYSSLDIADSFFIDNSAVAGGAILSEGAPITIEQTTISGNVANRGGAAYLVGGDTVINESTLSGNTADVGGAIIGYDAALRITNSTLSGNQAEYGGAIYLYSYGDVTPWVIEHSTVVNNSAQVGGGIVASFYYNEGAVSSFTLDHSIIANNVAHADPTTNDLLSTDVDFPTSYSLIETPAPSVIDNGGNQLGVDPQLGPLQDNGGPTATHAPLSGSPLLEAGDPTFAPPPAVDQRGFVREAGIIDIGAVETTGLISIDPSTTAIEGGNATVDVTLTRAPGSTDAVTVDYTTVSGTAGNADYTTTSGTLTWGAGDSAPKTILIPITDDGLAEGTESFTIVLSEPTGGTTLAHDTSTVTIGGAGAGELQFATADYAVSESGGTITLTVTRINGSAGSVSVDYATADGSATLGSDYGPSSGTLTFADADVTPRTITIPIVSDATPEGDENFTVTLSSPTNGAALGAIAVATVSITEAPLTFVVTNLNDSGEGSLRQAVIHSNSATTLDTVTFESGLTGTIVLTSGEIDVVDSVVVDGPGSSVIAVSGSDLSRIFDVDVPADGDVRIEGVTLTDGRTSGDGGALRNGDDNLLLTDVAIRDSVASGRGGGLFQGEGSLTIDASVISGNEAILNGGGIASGNSYCYCGGPLSLEITDTRITGNRAGVIGGGVYVAGNPDTNLVIADSAISGNSAVGQGGGGFIGGGRLYLDRTDVSDNLARNGGGGGLALFSTDTIISDSTFSGNTANDNGGGLALYGGALDMTSTTFSGNTVTGGDGGGIYFYLYGGGDAGTIRHSTIVDNQAAYYGGGIALSNAYYDTPSTATLHLDHTIVANNSAPTDSDLYADSGIFEARFSLIETVGAAPITDLGGNITGVDPQLGALQDNGGPTRTHAPLPGSPLLDAGNPAFVPPPATDQRGFDRTFSTIDIGSVEAGPFIQFDPVSLTVSEDDGSVMLTLTITGTPENPVSVHYTAISGSATAGSDFTASTGTVTWGTGDTAPKTINIPITDDGVTEGAEMFSVVLSGPEGGAVLGNGSTATVTIGDAVVTPGAIEFSPANVTIDENGATLTLTVTRTAGSEGAISATYATASGTATAGSDFTTTSGTVSFADGDTTPRTIDIPILDDTLVEGDEIFTVTLTGTNVGAQDTAAVTINDVEQGVLQFSAPTYNVDENGVSVSVTVTRSGGSDGEVSAEYATANGSAAAGSDYISTSGSVAFAGGDATPRIINIPILDDAVVEGDETFTIALSGANIGAQNSATITINDVEAGVLQFSAPTYTASESGGSASITVTRSGGSDGAVSASYSTSNGTAAAGTDYTTTSGSVSFADGATTPQIINVPIANDGIVEPDETFSIALSAPTNGATLGPNSSAVVTITDVSPGELQFSAPTYSVAENGTTVTITVQRVNGTTGAVGASYATSNGTAAAGADYVPASGTVSFDDGDSTPKLIVINITDDTLVEGNETFNIALSAPTGGATLGGMNSAVVTITDVEPGLLQFGAPAYHVDENGGTVSITVTRTGGANGSVSADYATVAGSAGASDFTPSNGTVTFVDGDTTPQTIHVPITDDTLVEGNESFTVTLTGANVGAQNTTSVTIADVEPGTLQFSAPTYTAGESGGSATLTVTRGGGTTGSVSATYSTSNGSAVAGSDYTASSGTVTFPDGDATPRTITIPIANDGVAEPDEAFNVSLSAPTNGATLGANDNAVVFITDVSPGSARFDSATYSTTENAGTATITVTRSGGSDGELTVDYSTGGGTATSGSDYDPASGTIVFADGDAAPKSFTISLVDDALVEGGETVDVTLTGASAGTPATATLSIADDDVDTTQFTITNISVGEGGTVTLTVQRNGIGPATINYATVNGTATGGSDFTPAAGVLTFPAGSGTQNIVINITSDGVPEGLENFTVVLSNPVGTTIGGNSSVNVAINAHNGSHEIPTASEWGKILLTIGLALAGLFTARRGRLFGLLLALFLAFTMAARPASAQMKPHMKPAKQAGVERSRRVAGHIAELTATGNDLTIKLHNGRTFTADKSRIKVRDLRERGKGKGKPKKNAGTDALAAGQEVTVVRVVRDNNGKKETERLVVRILG
ncbi:MAG TPA: Calx-beta domain-containing protein [Thermoanaerobaculia bacterium]|jgi:hypothetical protein